MVVAILFLVWFALKHLALPLILASMKLDLDGQYTAIEIDSIYFFYIVVLVRKSEDGSTG